MHWRRSRVSDRLRASLDRLAKDPVLRRCFRYDPEEALARVGFPGPVPTGPLPVNPLRIQANLDEATLFMPRAGIDCSTPKSEVKLVALRAKPLALLHGPAASLAADLRWADRQGLVGLFGPHEFDVREEGRHGCHNLALDPRPAHGMSDGWRQLLVSTSEVRVLLGYLALLFGWDEYLGLILGYPECCTRFFGREWARAVRELDGDLSGLDRISSDTEYDWRLNTWVRYSGHSLLDHFPCGLSCEASVELADRFERAYERYDPASLATLRETLSGTVLWAGPLGVFKLGGATRVDGGDGRWHYVGSRTSALSGFDEAFYRSLRQHESLSVSGMKVEVGGREVRGTIARFSNDVTP